MRKQMFRFAVLVALAGSGWAAYAQTPSPRLALVVGEAQYRDGALATAANDGGLMADMLRQAGFDVTGAANLSQDQMRSTFREFLEKASAAGPQAQIFVYLSGKGLQFAGDNYLAPVEATIGNSASVPAEAVRLSDFIGPLEQMPAQGRVIVLDIARPNEFGRSGQPLAGGLAIMDAPDNTLVAFNAAPGTIAPNESGPYGAYAQALVEMLRQPGLPIDDAFAQIRLRVNEATRGAQTPWDVTKLAPGLVMFEPAPGAPPRPAAQRPPPVSAMRGLPPAEAYGVAVGADTFEGYNQFIALYPGDPLARRVRAMLAARREALTWYRTIRANSPEAYWTYLRRYPNGPHAGDAERRLAFISAPLAPPPQFAFYDYDVPPPPPDEIVIIDRPRFYINEVVDVPPPPLPIGFLPPIAPEYRQLPPPPPQPGFGFLPIPIPIPIPFARPVPQQGFVTAPRFVQQPVAQPGAPTPAAGGLPQGYSPAPAGGPGRPGAGAPPNAAPPFAGSPGAAPGRPAGAPPAPAPGTSVTPPPSQALPRPGQNGAPPPPAATGAPGLPPGQRGPNAGQPTGAPTPGSQAPGTRVPGAGETVAPKAGAPNALPSVSPNAPRPGGLPPGANRPQTGPSSNAPVERPGNNGGGLPSTPQVAPRNPTAPTVAPKAITAPPPVPHVTAPPPVPHETAPPPAPHVTAPPPVPHVSAPPPVPHVSAPPPMPHVAAPPPMPHVAAPPPPHVEAPKMPPAAHAPGGAPHPGEHP